MSGQSGGHRLRLSKLNDQLTCKLCGGYFIDATTIIECLHSFCRSCIVKYLENNKYCPICEVQVHKSKPLLNIRPDHTLQDIVYKLVPGCYQNEMRCRREFYSKNPDACSQGMSPEARGEPTESHIYSPDESLSLSLEYFNPCTKDSNNTNACKDSASKSLQRRYLRCPAAVTVFHLQKLIRAKYGLTDAHRVDVMYKEEPLCSGYSLMDIMYIYHWRRKVPLHLSYRIFESSPKRIKLSEDNVNYKTSLLRAGIDPIDEKGEKLNDKEWKEVQLKISESGVMSITDISSPQDKRAARGENVHEEKSHEDTSQTEIVANVKEEKIKSEESDQRDTLPIVLSETEVSNIAGNLTEKPAGSYDSIVKLENSSEVVNCTNSQSETAKTPMDEVKVTSAKSNQTVQDSSKESENNNVEIKTPQVQIHVEPQEFVKLTNEKKSSGKSVEECDQHKQISKNINNNNNNNNTIVADTKVEGRKQNSKMSPEIKTVNAGSKIDALSAKLQFQPKVSQSNNALKRPVKEKKVATQAGKRIETRTTENSVKSPETKSADASNTKSRTNCTIANNKAASIKGNAVKSSSTSTADGATLSSESLQSNYVPATSFSSAEIMSTPKENVTDKNIQLAVSSINRIEKPSTLVDQKTNSHEQVSIESQQKIPVSSANTQKSQLNQNESTQTTTQTTTLNTLVDSHQSNAQPAASQSGSPSCSISQATPTYSYTVQNLVNNAMLKGSLKNLASVQSTMSSCNMQDHPVCSVPQFAIQQAQCMNIQHVVTSLKNNYSNQSIITSCATPRQVTGVYSVPPCPDAIPISLMKPTIRKSEVITKGTNLNEICAKIGASGSKINDICAKIGENSKERNKSEARNKSEIPDLLKIGRKSSSPSSSSESNKHTSIPNVPVYSPSNSTITTENKNVYSSVKDSLRAAPLVSTSSANIASPQATVQKASTAKKQSQAVGYKTLRDPPRCWNPTLSKNNYIAVKNQAKEMQNQPQASNLPDRNKPIQSKPAKIFKVRNVPRYLGNPASGVKPMYGIGNETKEKEQPTAVSKNSSLNMMKIDPKTLSPIVSTSNSPIVSPPPYSPTARSYQNTPFSRDICRSTGSPISPKNSPVNMLSTNPFIPSPTPNTNPRLIYSHFPPPFPDATRFPNPLIRSPIGIPPPSAFHSSLPPSINKLYQRSSYIPQTTGFPQVSQPPTVQRIPPSSYSSPKSPKTTSLTAISPSSFNIPKSETQLPTTTSLENVASLLSENVSSHDEANVFNLSKTGSLGVTSSFGKSSSIDTIIDVQSQKPSSPVVSTSSVGTSTSKQSSTSSTSVTTTSTMATSTTTVPITSTSTTSSPMNIPACTSASISTSASSASSSASLPVQASIQTSQMSKDKSQAETNESSVSVEGKENVEKDKGKDTDREVEKENREENSAALKTTNKEKKRSQETIENTRQEKKEKSGTQVNGEVLDHSGSSSSKDTAPAEPTLQCKKENADRLAKEEISSNVTSAQPSADKPADKQQQQQSEQQSQRISDTEESTKEAETAQNKSEAQASSTET